MLIVEVVDAAGHEPFAREGNTLRYVGAVPPIAVRLRTAA
jgi:hypothetical protein